MDNKAIIDEIKKKMEELEAGLSEEQVKTEETAPEEIPCENILSENVSQGEAPAFDNQITEERFCEEPAKEGNKDKKEKKEHGFCKIFLGAAAAFVLFVILLAVCIFVPTPKKSLLGKFVSKYSKTTTVYVDKTDNGTNVGGKEIPSGSNVEIKVETDSIASAVYAKCKDSIVGIRITQSSGYFWDSQITTVCEGSGVVYSEDGYIITNHHIVENAMDKNGKIGSDFTIEVYLYGDLDEYFPAELIGYDSTTDLALIKIDKKGLLPMTIADSEKIEIGSNVVAIGNPGGLDYMNSVTTGIVSGLKRKITDPDTGLTQYDMVQTDTPINPGNSGGALINAKGELIGICSIKIVASGYDNMGFAISSNTVKSVISEIQKNGTIERPLLGVTIYTAYNRNIANEYGYPMGCYVQEVSGGSCSEKAGIKAKDIITEMDGQAVKNFDELKEKLMTYRPGDSVKMKVFRISEEKYIEVTVVLDSAK